MMTHKPHRCFLQSRSVCIDSDFPQFGSLHFYHCQHTRTSGLPVKAKHPISINILVLPILQTTKPTRCGGRGLVEPDFVLIVSSVLIQGLLIYLQLVIAKMFLEFPTVEYKIPVFWWLDDISHY